MTWDQILVSIIGLSLICLIIKYFWLKGKKATVLTPLKNGVQQVHILVKGGYTPDTVSVKHGVPVELLFRREENSSCSEMVLLPDFNQSLKLPEGKEVNMQFTPDKVGEFEFSCQMGMLRGKLIVEL